MAEWYFLDKDVPCLDPSMRSSVQYFIPFFVLIDHFVLLRLNAYLCLGDKDEAQYISIGKLTRRYCRFVKELKRDD